VKALWRRTDKDFKVLFEEKDDNSDLKTIRISDSSYFRLLAFEGRRKGITRLKIAFCWKFLEETKDERRAEGPLWLQLLM
jgi:hypothetical protein